jgi:hypothetical protein
LNTEGATDAKLLVNHGNLQRLMRATASVERDERLLEQLG